MKKNDFFFGEKCESMSLHAVIDDIAGSVSADFFTAQLNRYLSENNGRMEFRHNGPCPPFSKLLGKINKECIGNIKIFPRTDKNSAIGVMLSCEILMNQGIITIATQWCAYKEARAKEMISSLLIPIYLANVQSKTYLKWNDEKLEPLSTGSLEYEISEVFALADNAQFPIEKKYIDSIACATEIGSKGLAMSDAQNEHFDKMHSIEG